MRKGTKKSAAQGMFVITRLQTIGVMVIPEKLYIPVMKM